MGTTKKTQLLTEPLVKVKATPTTPAPTPRKKKTIARIEAAPPVPVPPTLSERLQTLLREPVLGPALTASVVATLLTLLVSAL